MSNKLNMDKFRIIWGKADKIEWEKILSKVEKSNLLQSWAYGEAKASVEGWKVRRAFIYHNDTIAGMVQVLEKSWPLIGGVIRINRGPLLLNETLTSDQISSIYNSISKQWPWWKRRILLIAPELLDIRENSEMLHNMKFRSRHKKGWQSAWLDLGRSEEELRKSLNGKWRNMLNFGEKSNLKLNISMENQEFNWLMGKYEELMSIKGFNGTSIKLLTSLRSNIQEQDGLIVLQALYGDKPVAGILIARHGVACTYLVGWNGIEGRDLKANNFLLWSAIVLMKRRGCLWFDVGGIDHINTPSIAKFKQGMSGEEYKLVGEYRR